jgi:signal transduction histidine kinase/CheY-like chemotaxis protein
MRHPNPAADPSERVLIFAPVGRDAALTQEVLTRGGIASHACASISELCQRLEEGTGALLLTEEALEDRDLPKFLAAVEHQPPWSDVSTLLFAGGPHAEVPLRTLRIIEAIRNVTMLDRPIRIAAVLSSVRAALRSRRRQYEVRDLLVALHRARAEAENANRLKDEFLATLSHELRTPLNAILGWTTMLRHDQVPADRLTHVFEVLERNAQAQAQLIADVLDVSRIITGKLQLALQPVEIATVVRQALDAIRPAALTKGVDVELEADETMMVRGDPDRLQQVFWNLLSNAVKFTPAGGRIVVAMAPVNGSAEVSVTDNGIGIPPEFLPHVFDRFRQADQSTTRSYGGLGLGLAIVRHLVELHGGNVSAESGGGRGSTFRVRLPVPAASHEPIARRPPESSTADEFAFSFPGITVLLVDDDASTRDLLTTVLEATGAAVLECESADAAYEALRRNVPDIIVADLGMPEEDGFSLLRRVRSSREPWRDVPAIALSAYVDLQSEQAALAVGFARFLAKPARPQDLLRTMDEVLTTMDRWRAIRTSR